MRFIDADKLIEKLAWLDEYDYIVFKDVKCTVDETPTIKAIPIEWIKKWCNEHNRKSLEERLLKRYGVITMLEDWEKENEHKESD